LERKEGEKGEEMEGFIGRSRGGNWCLNLPGIKSGKHSLAAEETVALMAGGGRRLTSGTRCQRGKEGREGIPVRFAFLGCGLDPQLGRKGSLRPFSIFTSSFSFSFSAFLFLL
jgi:hypothetical protein